MQSYYKKLTAFEGALVVMIVLGVALIGLEIFVSLPARTQVAFTDAVQIFDMHDSVVEQAELLGQIPDSMIQVYQQFDLAFVQTMALGDQFNQFADLYETTFEKTSALASSSLALLQQQVPAVASAQGLVLGATTSAEPDPVSQAVSEPKPAYEIFYFPELPVPKAVARLMSTLTQN
jgi:hypothetical protein